MSVQINGTNGLTFNDGSSQQTAASGFGFKNRIINGACMIDQRNAGASVTVTNAARQFPVDRIICSNTTDGTFTAQQSTDVPATGQFRNSIVATVTVADTSIAATQYAQINQRIEGNNIADLMWGTANAQAVTVSFWVKSSVTGTYCVSIYNNNGSRCYVDNYVVNAANTWERKTITIPGDTSGTWQTGTSTGLDLIFCLGVGSTYQAAAGSWTATSFAIGTSSQTNWMNTVGSTFYITGVQLEKGSTATSFDYRPYGTELALCQRYYYRTTAGAADNLFGIGSTVSTTGCLVSVPFPVTMRVAPSALETTGTPSNYDLRSNVAYTVSSGPTFAAATTNAASISAVSSGMTAGYVAAFRASVTGAYLGWSAEL